MSSLDHIDAPKAILVGRFHLSLLEASGANHARAVRGVADRLLGVLIGMLRTQTLYQPPATTT